jgi:CARDB
MSRVGSHVRVRGRHALLVAAAVLSVGAGTVLLRGFASGSSAEPTRAEATVAPRAAAGAASKAADTRVVADDAKPAAQTAPQRDVVRLLAGSFDPLSDSLPAQHGIPLRSEVSLPRDQPQYWLVQVRDQRFRDVARAVRSAGGAIAGVIPDDTYMVRATPTQRAEIARTPTVRWMGYYQPAWRVPVAMRGKKALLDLAGKRIYRVYLFRDDPNAEASRRALARMAGVKVVADGRAVLHVRATAARIPAIAALPAVQWIGVKPRVVAHNVNARWVNDTGIRDVYAATAAGRLTGAGQTAAVADTGLNYTYDLNGRAHIGFRDCNPDGTGCKQAIYTQITPGVAEASMNGVRNNATGHRKMVAYFDIGNTGPNMFDESSHGTHVAGSVDGDQPPFNQFTAADGLAPAAKHVHQNIASTSGGLVLPADDYDLWRQAYRPRNPASVSETSGVNGNPGDYIAPGYVPLEDARTHNNSYGLLAPVIDEGSAVALDQFVWDHEDMAIVVSAGNAGPRAFTIGSPSVAKNELSSGASANGRQPMASIDSMAAFSSHGPTGDPGRFGVDLATPGQIVVSTKGGTTDNYHTAQGTSMSGPILAGLATLVRQYFYDGYAAAGGDGFAAGSANPSQRRHNPSAALVKAALINGAVRMRGRYTGDDGVDTLDGQWPSAGQGFGRVNLDNSLYFANDPVKTWYADVYRGDTANANANLRPFVMGANQSRTFQLRVAPGQPLDVTLSWTDAPNLLPAGTPALVNNLDLVVTGPGGATYVGNNMNSRTNPGVTVAETPNNALAPPDVFNLSERIRVASPVAGTYTITVRAPAIAFANQGFALAASGLLSPLTGPTFVAGPPLQRDASGSPSISNVRVETISANTAKIFFDTNEPTTATADVVIGGTPTTFVDSYNVGNTTPSQANFPGLNAGPSETSAEYADRPVVGTKHEILITGLAPGQAATATLRARDLASNPNTTTAAANISSPAGAYQADAPDIGQLYEDPATAAQVGQWKNGTQLYASDNGDGAAILGAFAFRIPPAAVNPANINAAAVELTSSHDWVNRYTEDPIYNVDLLPQSVETNWGTQDYNGIKSAAADARVFPETTHRRGAYYKHDFTFRCADLPSLRSTLSTLTGADRMAAFRWETQPANVGFLAMEFGFNRRSRGPAERPKLLLFTGQSGYPDGRPCSPATPAPTISQVGIHGGHNPEQVTVSWETDEPSNSIVLFREKGSSAQWTQVATPVLTQIHAVQVFGLDDSKDYEFVVRSAACSGATTTDTNGGAGYDFFRNTSLGTPTPGPSYSFESGDEGWTVASSSLDPVTSSWVRRATGANATANGWHVAIGGGPANSYSDEDTTTLTSPPVSLVGATAAVRFFIARDMEPTFDFMHVEYSTDGTNWTRAASIDGTNPEYPGYEPAAREVRFSNPGGSFRLRFRFASDQLISSPVHLGVSVDEVGFLSYPVAEQGSEENLPLVGPVPPPSAGGLSEVPATRTGAATQADIDAGTGFCSIPAGQQPPPNGNKPDLVVSELSAVNNRGDDDDDDFDDDGRKDDDDDDDDDDGRGDDDDDDDDNDNRRDGRGRQGDKVTITATVRNIGTASAGSSRTEFKIDGEVVALVNTGSIPAGGQRKVSIVWNTRNEEPGPHVIEATADRNNQVNESNESNNSRTLVYTVQPNQAGNGSFEDDDAEDDRPDRWSDSDTDAGTATWSDGGSDGLKSVSLTGTGGSVATGGSPTWTSAPIEVTAGALMDLQASVRASGASSAATAGLIYLGQLGTVVDRVTLLTAPLSTAGFTTLEQAVTIPAGVASVRIVLSGFAATDLATAGTVTFDDVGLFAR